MSVWLPVSNSELGEPIEIETEDDGKLLLTSVTSIFPGTTALLFRHLGSQVFCEVTAEGRNFLPPDGGWLVSTKYIATNGYMYDMYNIPTSSSASSQEKISDDKKKENDIEMLKQKVMHLETKVDDLEMKEKKMEKRCLQVEEEKEKMVKELSEEIKVLKEKMVNELSEEIKFLKEMFTNKMCEMQKDLLSMVEHSLNFDKELSQTKEENQKMRSQIEELMEERDRRMEKEIGR